MACFYPAPRKSARCTLKIWHLTPAGSPFPVSSTLLMIVVSDLNYMGWRHVVPSQNHYWYHCKTKPAARQCREVGLLPSLPNCMFKNKPLLVFKHLSDESYMGYFLYTCIHNILNWKQHFNWFKTITCCCLKQIRKFITVKMKCTYWYLKCIIKKTCWCCVFLVYQYLSHYCWQCLVFYFNTVGMKVFPNLWIYY